MLSVTSHRLVNGERPIGALLVHGPTLWEVSYSTGDLAVNPMLHDRRLSR